MIRTHPLLALYEKFIKESRSGVRRKPNQGLIKPQSISNYMATLKLLRSFETDSKFNLLVYEVHGKNKREFKRALKYWSDFYKKFSNYLYDNRGYFDNYVGLNIKNIRTFLNWLRNDKGYQLGEFHKKFYRPSEDIPLVTLSPDQFRFLAFDTEFEKSLSQPLQRAKNLFVFGCIAGLRFSDLLKLKWNNLETKGEHTYLKVRSQKTVTDTVIKLPPYAMNILDKQSRRRNISFSLFPYSASM